MRSPAAVRRARTTLLRVATKVAAKLQQVKLDAEEVELEVCIKSLQTELVAKQAEKALLVHSTQIYAGELSRGRTQMKELRGDDATIADGKGKPL